MFCRISQDRLTPDSLGERLRRLPAYAPPADGWQRLERRRNAPRRYGAVAGGLALAASVLLAVGLALLPPLTDREGGAPAGASHAGEVAQLIRTSQQLEQRLARVRPQVDVWDSALAQQAQQLEQNVALVDLQLNYAQAATAERLWRDRVELMNALVDLHQDSAPTLQYASYQY